MTCRQLGGPCDFAHHGEDANEVIKAQDRHLREAVASGATDHEPALTAMQGRWKRPISGMRWYRQAQRDFAALADEPEGESGTAQPVRRVVVVRDGELVPDALPGRAVRASPR